MNDTAVRKPSGLAGGRTRPAGAAWRLPAGPRGGPNPRIRNRVPGVPLLLGIAFCAILAGHALGLYRIAPISFLDRTIYDLGVRLSMPGGMDERIVIVDLDERSLASLGRWPWRRDRVAALVDQLFERYSAAVVGFDVAFAEPDPADASGLLEEIRRGGATAPELDAASRVLQPLLDRDKRLAEALRGRPVVLSYYFSPEPVARSDGDIGPAAMTAHSLSAAGVNPIRSAGYSGNLAVLQSAASNAGHFNAFSDDDGRTRRVPLLVEYAGGVYESLGLAVVRQMLGMPAIRTAGGGARQTRLQVGKWTIPVNASGAAYIPFRGPKGSFRYVSAADVLSGEAPVNMLQGKIILVGSSAPGLFDLRATPVSEVMPGVEMHANIISGILDQRLKSSPRYANAAAALLTLLGGAFLAFWLPKLGPTRGLAVSGAVMLLSIAIGAGLWAGLGIVFPLGTLLVSALSMLGLSSFHGYLVENKARREFARAFGPYVPPGLVEQMAGNPTRYRDLIKPRNETLSVLFADLRGFTSVAESMAPEKVRLFLNDYLTEMSQVIHEYRGTVDKYIGDEVMAFWGAPLDDPDHARHAVLTALDMQVLIARLRDEARDSGMAPFDLSVGINTGLMSVGDMGSTFRRSYTVLGDPVNLAKRLESLTRYYGVGVIIGEQTRLRIPDLICREIDWVQVRGRGEMVKIFEPLGFAGEISGERLEELELWNRALSAYRLRDWKAARRLLGELSRARNDNHLYPFYDARIARFERVPPPDSWRGVTVFDQK